MYFVVEYLPSGSAASDNPTRAYDDDAPALALKAKLDDQDRAAGTYRPGRWRVLKVS